MNNLVIFERLVYQDDFDKTIMEIFLKLSLKGIPKKVLITDRHPAYPAIIEEIGIKHQLYIFHIIKNHHDKSYKKNKPTRKTNRNTKKKNKRKPKRNKPNTRIQ